MAILKCKICGGDMNVSADKTFGTCEYCGSTMTLPKIDDEQRADAFNRGNHFRRIGEFDKALSVYERIVEENPNDAEAHWCCALCRFGIEWVEDPVTMEYLPTCHRASFDIFTNDVDYLAAIELSDGITQKQYKRDGAKISEVQKGILATSQNEKPFDVFICYKESDENGNRTVDSTLAQDIYYQLTEQGLRVFFARITLEDKVGSEYEPYIFAALNSAKVMVAVGTKPENFNAVWVKNEWSRFLSIVKHDRSKVLLPCYKDMDPYDLPEQLSVLQSCDMSKIGFIQDLIRGIEKFVNTEKSIHSTKTPLYNANSIIERGYIALESKEWKKAGELFEEALKNEPKNSDAYLGLSMVSKRYSVVSDFDKCKYDLKKDKNYLLAIKYADEIKKEQLQQVLDNTQNSLKAFRSKVKKRVKLIGIISAILVIISALGFGGYFAYTEYIVPAVTYSKAEKLLAENKYSEAKAIYQSLGVYKDSKDKVYEADYLLAEEYFANDDYINADKLYKSLKLSNYKDSSQKVIDVNKKYAEKLYNDGNYHQAIDVLVDVGIKSGELYDTIKAKIVSEAEEKAGAFNGTGYIECTVSELYKNPHKYDNKKVVVTANKVINDYHENSIAGTFYDLLMCDDTSRYQDYFGSPRIIRCYRYFTDIIDPYDTPYIGVRIFESAIKNTLADEKREIKVFGVFTYNSGTEGERYSGDPHVYDIKADHYVEY